VIGFIHHSKTLCRNQFPPTKAADSDAPQRVSIHAAARPYQQSASLTQSQRSGRAAARRYALINQSRSCAIKAMAIFAAHFSQGCLGKTETEIIPFEPGRVMPPRKINEVAELSSSAAPGRRATFF